MDEFPEIRPNNPTESIIMRRDSRPTAVHQIIGAHVSILSPAAEDKGGDKRNPIGPTQEPVQKTKTPVRAIQSADVMAFTH
jgi:hypothetical protein